MKNSARLLVSVALLIMFVAAIGLSPTAKASARACNRTCKIDILSPGGTLNLNANVGPSFIVSFAVGNITLIQPGTEADVNTTTGSGQNDISRGHIHVFVDNNYVTLWASPEGIPLTLSGGSHTVKLELVNDLHQSFAQEISDSTTVSVSGSAAGMAETYSLIAVVVSVITLVLVAYVAFARPKKTA